MSVYHSKGHSWLICPALLEIDKRHGEHWSRTPPCRRGKSCIRPHEHESRLPDGGGHVTVDFYWFPGCRPLTLEEHPACECGQKLVCTDLDDLYDLKHLVDPGSPPVLG